MFKTLGVLGGMGPLATLDFAHKIIRCTPAQRDQEHIPMLIRSIPQIPDRTDCLMNNSASPLVAMIQGLEELLSAGAEAIAIPCNTAHYWQPVLQAKSPVPVFHIAQACGERLKQSGIKRAALMATDGTIKAGFYTQILATHNIYLGLPTADIQRNIMQGIYDVKSGNMERGAEWLNSAFQALLNQGYERVILGCTEIPLALDHLGAERLNRSLDATSALASFCVDWSLSTHPLQAA